MDKLASSIIRDILIEEMQIPTNQIWIRNQNVVIPNDDEIYIAVGMIDTQVMSVQNVPVDEVSGLSEKQRVNMRENIQIDIHSRDQKAINRRFEVLAALVSVYSVQLQEQYGFRIFDIPTSFLNTSGTEGAENINKYSLVVPCFTWFEKAKAISTVNGDYYETFDTRVDDEETIGEVDGLIEFTITDA